MVALFPVVLAGLGVGLAATARLLASQRGRRFRTPPPWITARLALISGFVAAIGSAHPTSLRLVDHLLCFAIGALAVVVGLRVKRWPLVGALSLLGATSVLGGGSPAAAAFGGAGLGVAIALRSRPRPSPLFAALATSLGAQAALRLPTGLPARVPTVIGAVAFITFVVSAYYACRPSTRRRARRIVMVVAGIWFAGAAVSSVGLVLARRDALGAIAGGRTALRLVQESNSGGSAAALEGARHDIDRLTDHLSAWWMRPALAVPVMAQHVDALAHVAASARQVVEAAGATSRLADVHNFRVTGGGLDVARLQNLQAPSAQLDRAISDLRARLDGLDNPWLVGPLTDRAATLNLELAKADEATATLRRSLAVLPGLLGANGPRRYLLVVPTPAEARGSGGVIGNYGELVADHGHLRLAAFGRAAELHERGVAPEARSLIAAPDYAARYARFLPQIWWQNVTMSPDFPSAAYVMANLYPQSGGTPVDGVISVDPIGLAALLGLSGPIEVPGWPQPITADNAAQTLLFDQYVKFPAQDPTRRAQLLGTVATAVWQKVITATLPAPAVIGAALGPAARQRHFQLWSTRAQEQHYFTALHADGGFWPEATGDGVGVVVNNGSASKIDWFLHRALGYDVTIDRRAHTIRAGLDITLRNDAPATGLPRLIIGNDINPAPLDGTSRLYVSVYSRLVLGHATLDGQSIALDSQEELGGHVYSAWVTLASRSSRRLTLDLRGPEPTALYRLRVATQPLINADQLRVKVTDSGSPAFRAATKQWRVDQDRPLAFSLP